MAKNLKLDIHDDKRGDLVDVFIGKPYETDNYDLDFNLTLRVNPKTKKLVGLIMIQFSWLFPNCRDAKSRRLVAEAVFRIFERLYSERMLKEPRVA